MFHKFQTTCEQISLHKPQKMTNDHKFSMYVYEVIMFFFFSFFHSAVHQDSYTPKTRPRSR